MISETWGDVMRISLSIDSVLEIKFEDSRCVILFWCRCQNFKLIDERNDWVFAVVQQILAERPIMSRTEPVRGYVFFILSTKVNFDSLRTCLLSLRLRTKRCLLQSVLSFCRTGSHDSNVFSSTFMADIENKDLVVVSLGTSVLEWKAHMVVFIQEETSQTHF